ncbi:hypothetical protein ACFFSW_03750 [Saccharothrix longispora]|uniref:Uncharacterized protein n=1 Tax=Saccharothrix longispora TaxID=33920 RepID=A0ABU1PPZ2_9PSEU|nr:hypothetical protein [Saccharothrix longispora]MDR6592149.1 hypothetical protein [Saccharothrix longispora]
MPTDHLFPLASVEPVFGMPVENARKFQQVAAEQDLVIDVRGTNPHAVAWLRRGALPKPEAVKAKTIDDLDVRLGAAPHHRGLVGYFHPALPPADLTDRLLRRFDQRRVEYDALRDKMAAFERRGEYLVRGGVVHGYDRRGALRPLTGDHDVFDIRASGGLPLSGRRYDRAVATMMSLDMAVTHGAHMYWKPTTRSDRAMFESIAGSPDDKLRFHPDGTMTAGDYRRRLNAGISAITRPARAARPYASVSNVGSPRGPVSAASLMNSWP